MKFPLILLQAKAGGLKNILLSKLSKEVSINSPSGEGGGAGFSIPDALKRPVSINSPSGEGGGKLVHVRATADMPRVVSINSPSGEGGGNTLRKSVNYYEFSFPLILLQAKAGGVG